MTELAVIDSPAAPMVDVDYWAKVLVFSAQMADKVASTEFVAKPLRDRPEAVAACIAYGIEVGLTPMQALAGIHVVEGRPSPSAETMRALIFRAGHTISVHEATGTRCRVSGLRRGRPETERRTLEWTLDMARAAGLLGKTNWRNYPRAMLLARATSDLARELFPDVIKGLGYVAEDDADAVEAAWGPPMGPPVLDGVDDTAEPVRRKLQRTQRKAVGTAPAASEPVEDVPLPDPDERHLEHDPGQAQDVSPAVAPPTAGGTQAPRPSDPVPQTTDTTPTSVDVPLPPSMQPTGSGRPVDPTYPAGGQVPMPDAEPEPGPPEPGLPGEGPKLITPGPLRAINTMLTKELGSEATPEERHGLAAAMLGGTPVPSLRELTAEQGYALLAMFDRFATGEAGWSWDMSLPPPGIRVYDVADEAVTPRTAINPGQGDETGQGVT